MRQTGLYYPYVHVQDDIWMKTAALYWSQLARVVPRDYPVRDSETGKALADGLDFFVPVEPGAAPAAVEAPFLEVIREHPGTLRRYYEIREWQIRESTVVSPSLRRTNLYVPNGYRSNHSDGRPGGYIAHLYWQEVSPALREALIAEGLAVNADRPGSEGREPYGTWISMDPMLAWVYKCALTDELARRNRLVPTTDQMAAHRASQEWDTERVRAVLLRGRQPRADQSVSAVLGELAIQMVLPADLANVPVDKVIELRRKHEAEFDTFMDEVDSVASEMQEQLLEIEDREVLAAHLRQLHRSRFERPLNDLKAAMKSLKIDAATGVLNVQTEAPAVLGAVGGYAAGGLPYASALGLAFGLVGYRRQISKQRDEALSNSPVSFLLQVEDGLRPASVMRRLTHRAPRVLGT
ncbi:DUF6236 family protein [Streptomyces sp. H27-H1]|uniref:DUF6236 family protein n=1 Tax=unclassified Streptomyces TaxID=2593676 RepID=UPI00226DC285|nr:MULTISPECIES: DUF6236 family protein [unclassified Streptomyces]MCY0926943.1 DUF6236 family protein [Streptomyces sp. H27-H1]MCY0933207.1 DUF6236 family protein [Streptomyces sp. H34-S4]